MDAIESFIAVADWVFAIGVVALAIVALRRRGKTRIWSYAVGLLFVVELAFSWSKYVEPRFVEVTHERLPLAKQPLRIVAFSDLHAGRMDARDLARAVALANAEGPDVVLLAGDFISGYSLTDERRDKLQGLRGLVAKRVFAVLGNHDSEPYGADTERSEAITKLLEGFGYRVLRNEGVALAPDVWLGGVDEFQAQKSDAPRAFAGAPAEAKRIAVAHDWHALDAPEARFDLGVVGHTHGGQVCVPFTSVCAGPRRDLPYVRGRHRWKRGGVLYVTRGIGMSKVTLRFGSRPEVTVFDLGS